MNEEIQHTLQLHAKWLRHDADGKRAVFSDDADLSGVDFSGLNLSVADLSHVNLSGANLSGANLRRVTFTESNLTGADLRNVALYDNDFSCANMVGALLPDDVPVVPDLDRQILAAVGDGNGLDMEMWHRCNTIHCVAGWAVTLAGQAGAALESLVGTNAAAALIYAASSNHPVPDFFATHSDALAEIRRRAGDV